MYARNKGSGEAVGWAITALSGRVVQSVMCLVTDVCLTTDPGVASSILAWSHTFMEMIMK